MTRPKTTAEAIERIEAMIHAFNTTNYHKAAELGFMEEKSDLSIGLTYDSVGPYLRDYLERRRQLAIDILDMLRECEQ